MSNNPLFKIATSITGAEINYDGSVEITSTYSDEEGYSCEATRYLSFAELEALVAEARAFRDGVNQ